MPARKFHARFLVRGSALLIVLLMVWWFVLQNPMLLLLRQSVNAVCVLTGISPRKLATETANGSWTFEVPMEFTAAGSPAAGGGRAQYHSINFDVARSDVSAFTFSLPVYWAVMLAAPGIGRSKRALIQGTFLMALLEILLLLVFVEIVAHNAAAQMSGPQGAIDAWLLHIGHYLVVNVLPYVAPFAVAVCLHRELREELLGWASAAVPAQNTELRAKHHT